MTNFQLGQVLKYERLFKSSKSSKAGSGWMIMRAFLGRFIAQIVDFFSVASPIFPGNNPQLLLAGNWTHSKAKKVD